MADAREVVFLDGCYDLPITDQGGGRVSFLSRYSENVHRLTRPWDSLERIANEIGRRGKACPCPPHLPRRRRKLKRRFRRALNGLLGKREGARRRDLPIIQLIGPVRARGVARLSERDALRGLVPVRRVNYQAH